MVIIIRLIGESFRFAWHALKSNVLRTILSLLGVTIGIFTIITVLSAVDGLDKSIRKSLSFLGSNVIYVQKWPWSFSENYPWWKYFRRPVPSSDEYTFVKEQITEAQAVSIFAVKGGLTLRYENNTRSSVTVLGISYDHKDVADIRLANGRYFNPQEADNGHAVALIGSNVAESLFPTTDPIGKDIRIKGIPFRVIGKIEKQGDNLLGFPSNDNAVMIPYKALVKLFSSNKGRGVNPTIAARAKDDDPGMYKLEGDLQQLMRRVRRLKPKDDDTFALNRTDTLASFVDGITATLSVIGSVIALFSILIGGFGIANIMFVSVKERTNLIGIQKSLGAKNYFILLQFLLEAMFLSIFGGMIGISLVYLVSLIPISDTFALEFSIGKVILGLTVSSIIGIISGIVPAISASRMDPVEAIRTN
jgi:putative ABC transport system permease protein